MELVADRVQVKLRLGYGVPSTDSSSRPAPFLALVVTSVTFDITAHDRGLFSGDAFMRQLKLSRVFTLIEPGPVILVTTNDVNRRGTLTPRIASPGNVTEGARRVAALQG